MLRERAWMLKPKFRGSQVLVSISLTREPCQRAEPTLGASASVGQGWVDQSYQVYQVLR